MKKYFIALSLALALVASPAVAGAQALSIDQLLSLISTLQAQIAALTNQLNQLQGGSSSGSGGGVSSSISGSTGSGCVVITRPLYRGISDNESGGEVTRLQSFLRAQGVYNDDITGFYGPATEAGVKRFQAQNNIVSSGDGASTGYGLVGSLTRARIQAVGCVPPNPVPPPVPPVPVPIPVPPQPSITVTSPNGGESWVIGQSYKITWLGPSDYKWPTNYLLQLDLIDGPTPINFRSVSPVPTSGLVSGTLPSDGCYSDYCYQIKPGSYRVKATVYDGKPCLGSCPPNSSGYLVKEVVSDTSDSYFKITDSTSTNKPPVITGLTAPSSLVLGETGKWEVKAYDPEGGALSYSVNWGEDLALAAGTSAKVETAQTSTFTHSYSTASSYKVTITVSDNAGQSAQTSATVQVYISTPPPPSSITVTTPNGGESWDLNQQHLIHWTSSNVKNANVYLNFEDGGACFLGTVPASIGVKYFPEVIGNVRCPNIDKSITAGNYTVLIYGDDEGTKDRSDGSFTITNLTPTLKASLSVMVLNGDVRCFTYPCEIPLYTSTVYLYNAVTGAFINSQAATKGTVIFSNLDPGTYRVIAKDPNLGASTESKVGLVSGQNGSLKLTLSSQTYTTNKTTSAADSQLAAVLQSLQSVLNSLSTGL